MAKIVVAGGGICGMAAAMLLARDGHEVVVLERDEAPVPPDPDASWDSWARRSVGQFRIAHLMLPSAATRSCGPSSPMSSPGCRRPAASRTTCSPTPLPRSRGRRHARTTPGSTPRTGRRPTIEWAFATAADDEPGVTVRRGVAIRGLLTGSSPLPGVPHVTGVVLADGEEVDRRPRDRRHRSPLPHRSTGWPRSAGRPPSRSPRTSASTYTGRFWRVTGRRDARDAGARAHGRADRSRCLTIPSDNCTWSTTIYTVADDAAMRAVRKPEVFERVWRSFPDHAQWLDGEPISDMATMSGAVDRSRHFVVDGAPVVTGMLTIADAAACTNPSVGRGMSLGLLHTVAIRDVVRQHLGDPAALALAFHEATVEQLDPWHQATKDLDRGRIAEMQAAIDGVALEPTPEAQIAGALAGATAFDADALRWFLELLVVPHAPDGAVRPPRRVRAGARAGAAGPPARPLRSRPHPTPGARHPMIVFVHGNPETAAIWDPLIAALGRDDVVALSPPGLRRARRPTAGARRATSTSPG